MKNSFLKIKRFAKCFIALVIICVSCTSCSVFSDPQTLMSPPKAQGELKGIEDALSASIGAMSYSFVYTISGDNRSACITEDIDNNGLREAFVFYKIKENNEIHINLLINESKDEKTAWQSVFDMALTGTGVDKVDFVDLCGDSKKEILIGCNMYNESSNVLYIYDFTDASKLIQMTKENYTNYTICNLTGDNKSQIMLFNLGTSTLSGEADINQSAVTKTAAAKLITLNSDTSGITTVIGNVGIDRSMTAISAISQTKTIDGKTALLVDAYKGSSLMITEVLCYDNGLKNLYCDIATGENISTRRQILINSRDIDDDKMLEIPFAEAIADADKSNVENAMYYTTWKKPKENGFEKVSSGYFTATGKYYLKLSDEWINSTTVKSFADESKDSFYKYDALSGISEELISIKTFDKMTFNKNSEGYIKAVESEDKIVAVKVNEKAEEYGVDYNYLKRNIVTFN